MKKIKKHISALLALAVIASCAVLAYADQENGFDVPGEFDHAHKYQVVAFDNGIAACECIRCGESKMYIRFDEHINERGFELLDMNGDGIVNAKDYAILLKNY